jgi:hypothetical protein
LARSCAHPNEFGHGERADKENPNNTYRQGCDFEHDRPVRSHAPTSGRSGYPVFLSIARNGGERFGHNFMEVIASGGVLLQRDEGSIHGGDMQQRLIAESGQHDDRYFRASSDRDQFGQHFEPRHVRQSQFQDHAIKVSDECGTE